MFSLVAKTSLLRVWPVGLDLGKVGALGAWVCYQVELVYSLDLCNKVSEVHSE